MIDNKLHCVVDWAIPIAGMRTLSTPNSKYPKYFFPVCRFKE